MITKIILKLIQNNKALIQKLYSLLPNFVQKKILSFYRKTLNKSLQIQSNSDNASRQVFLGDSYNLSKIYNDLPAGINLIGMPRAALGLGEHLRSAGKAMVAGNIDHSYYDVASYFMLKNEDNSVESKISESLNYNTSLFVCNGDAIGYLYKDKGQEFFKNKYNIHYGAWELSLYPKEWLAGLSMFDEYWAMSSFLQKSVSDSANIPVIYMPYPVEFDIPQHLSRDDFGLPRDKFLYLFTFDMSSVMERKNPKAVIKSFLAAFPKEKDVGLVIKVSSKKNLNSQQKDIENLLKDLKSDERVYLINEVFSREKILGLINVCDVYVSLHRAEGFGIGMAEAMKMGKAVIATNYSGNTDFTLPNNSCLVDYKLIPLKELDYIYEKGQVWADADIDHAAHHMKKLFEDSSFYKEISSNAKNFIDKNYSSKEVSKKYLSRLKILGII